MAPPEPARIARVLARVEGAIAPFEPRTRALAIAVVGPARAAAGMPGWPPVVLPLVLGEALGLAPEAAEGLAAACVLFFASADVIDDAQDGELPAAFAGAWPAAVAVGLALLFASQRVALEAAPGQAGAIAAAFAEAGLAMSLGQAADVGAGPTAAGDLAGAIAAAGGEAAYLACVRGKTGGSIALFATLPAIASGRRPAEVAALRAWGEAAGAALQLASDLADATAPTSRDGAAGRATLPIAHAWGRLGPAERPLLEAAWRGAPEAPDLAFLLHRTGTATYVGARVATLRIAARDALAAGDLPPPLVAGLDAWVEALTAGGRAPL